MIELLLHAQVAIDISSLFITTTSSSFGARSDLPHPLGYTEDDVPRGTGDDYQAVMPAS